MTETASGNIAAPAPDPWKLLHRVACDVSVEVELPGFRVSDLLALQQQSVVDTHWPLENDLPLRVNGELLGWCEFDVVGNRLAVRLTELA